LSKTIGILTGGGDCPGLNAVIRAVVRKSGQLGYQTLGILEGWRGLMEAKWEPLDLDGVGGILPRGGTILRTSRTNPSKRADGIQKVIANFEKAGLYALVAVGGDDTISVAKTLHEHGKNVIAVPKTIDNDLSGTDQTFGFDTAVNIATEAIDRVHSTAEAHQRVMVVEVMGRDTGWIAVASGMAGGADVILIPEVPIDLDQVADILRKRQQRGRDFSIVVVAEGCIVVVAEGCKLVESRNDKPQEITQSQGLDEFGHVRLGGIAQVLGREIEKRTGFETRYVILGHIQRGGSPTAFDRILATRFGVAAAEMVHKGEFGRMVALKGREITSVPFTEALVTRKVDDELYRIASTFFG
jgi:ATP-dependent phosphofructokinase / diphosphate-dependent phosphofructokinase